MGVGEGRVLREHIVKVFKSIYLRLPQLVGGLKPSETCKSVGMMTFPIYGKIKHVPNHQPVRITAIIHHTSTSTVSYCQCYGFQCCQVPPSDAENPRGRAWTPAPPQRCLRCTAWSTPRTPWRGKLHRRCVFLGIWKSKISKRLWK